MASLTRKILKGRAYYYLRECKRVNGKPKIVRQEYLGTADRVAELLAVRRSGGRARAPHVSGHQFGAVTALVGVARELDVVATIDRHVGFSSSRGLTVGTYLLLAAINRCVGACSKARFSKWYFGTVLPRLIPMDRSQLTSQRFWQKMGRVSEDALTAIDRELSRTAIERFKLNLSTLFYDATNFFTFIDSFNGRSKLAQRGKSKEGRDNLRILGLALLVTRQDHVPLLSHLYAGNQHDAVTFRGLLEELVARYKLFVDHVEDITVVFDKGNNAQDIIERLDDAPYHFVGSLVPTQHPKLLAIPRVRMRALDPEVLPKVRSYRTSKVVFGAKRTVLVTYNTALFRAQTKTLTREITKRLKKLQRLEERLDRWHRGEGRGKPPTSDGVRKTVDQILKARHMKQLIVAKVTGKGGLPRISYRLDRDEWNRLKRTLLGKTLLFTDQHGWTDEEIVLAYRGQAYVEAAFRQMKRPVFVSFRPTFHWTDQKLRVHAFYCVLALTLASLLRKRLREHGVTVSVDKMLESLHGIRESTLLYDRKQGSPTAKHVIDDMDPLQQRMFDALDLRQYAA